MAKLAYDRLFDALVRELVRVRTADIELASTSLRPMADIKEDEAHVGRVVQQHAAHDRGPFRAMLQEAERRGSGMDEEITYDSADEAQGRAAELIARYLVSLGYADMRTEQAPTGSHRYRVRFRWDRLRRLQGPGE